MHSVADKQQIPESEALESQFPNLYTFSKSIEPLSRNRDQNMTQDEHVHAILVTGSRWRGHFWSTCKDYQWLRFEDASSSSA